MTSTSKHQGTCLCGDVRIEVVVDLGKGSRCNCTWCTKLGVTASLVKPAAFTLLSEEASLAAFTRSPEIGSRFFCARCHVYCFSRGRLEMLGGDFVSVNLNCVDGFDASQAELLYFDGRHDNWHAGPRPEPWPISAAGN